MPSEFEDRIRRNRVDLQRSMVVGEMLLAYLLQGRILSSDDCEEIRVERTRSRKVSALLDMLPRRGPKAEAEFINALQKTGQAHVVVILKRGSVEPTPSQPVEEDKFDDSKPLIKFTLKSTPEGRAQQIQREVRNYPMRHKTRGRAVILNIINYDPKELQFRNAADIDSQNMEKLLEDLNFTVDVWKDVANREELETKLEKERDHEDHNKADAFIYVMMAHGQEDVIHLKNGETINILEIVKYFTGIECETLRGKPKIFFIQACQGKERSLGVPYECDGSVVSGIVQGGLKTESDRMETDGSCQSGAVDSDFRAGSRKMVFEGRDIYLAFSTAPGYQAYRDPNHGSWFIRSLVKIFAKHAHEHELDYLMTEVSGLVAELKKDGKFLQCCCIVKTFTKHLYFLPGHFTIN